MDLDLKRKEYEKQTKRYDFDSFDQAFYKNDDFHKKIFIIVEIILKNY